MIKTIVLIAAMWIIGMSMTYVLQDIFAPVVSADIAINQLTESDEAWMEMRAFEKARGISYSVSIVVLLCGTAAIWKRSFNKGKVV